MSFNISTYPVLNDSLRNAIWGTGSDNFRFSYTRDGEEYELFCEEIGEGTRNYKLIDESGNWDPDKDNLIVKRKYSLEQCNCLFGGSGIACSNATIGIAVVWHSKDSKQRNAIRVGQIRKDGNTSFKLYYNFGNACLRGAIGFKTILYIDEPGTPFRDEAFANTYGTLLGELDQCLIHVDGNGSMFPIYEVYEPGQPLWNIKCSWEDPTCDLFADTVEININTAHRNYIYLDKSKHRYDPQLMLEIMASALSIIVEKLKADPCWDETVAGTGFQHGSVSEAIYYFISTLEWDVSTSETMALSIRNFFDNKDIR